MSDLLVKDLVGHFGIGQGSVSQRSEPFLRAVGIDPHQYGAMELHSRVHVGEHNQLDPQPALVDCDQVFLHVTTRIHHHRPPGHLVRDQVRGLRETRQIELIEDHRSSPSDAAIDRFSNVKRLPGLDNRRGSTFPARLYQGGEFNYQI